jgi:glycyl-tRNA synthetase beta chain
MADDLILEIGTEELPPSCTRKGLEGLKAMLAKKLEESHIGFEGLSAYSSPRRLAAYIKKVNPVQDTVEKTVTGPPKKISFGPDGKPGEAAKGFAKSLGLDVSELEEIELEGKGIYLGKKIVQEGKKTEEILPEILKDTVLSLSFDKQMSWGDYDLRFIRPIRWLLALMGNKVISFSIGNVKSGNMTYGHHTLNTSPIEIKSAKEYAARLKSEGNVIVDPANRQEMIYKQAALIEKNTWDNKYKAIIEKKLLEDVADLVEIPNVLAGSFPEEFLYIPTDILMEAIQHHQKYFPVADSSGRLTTSFLIVQNGVRDNGDIKKGNERVLKARLSDASFFYEQDRKNDFACWEEKLNGVIFYSGLGNMHDKQERLKEICIYIAGAVKSEKDKNLIESLKKASLMCKCDLVTNLVVEFPELQGVVGREYARERGYDNMVSEAIFEHYLPRSADDKLPATMTGRILSIADKADTIIGMFLAGNIPSGSEDPFALRRRASGMVRSILEGSYDIGIRDLIEFTGRLYREAFDIKETGEDITGKIFEFIQARQRFLMSEEDKRMDVLEAVLGSGVSSLLDISARCDAVWKYMSEKDITSIVWPMSRSKNIVGGKETGPVDHSLFREEHEINLYEKLVLAEKKAENLLHTKEYDKFLELMEGFGKTVDAFFDEVLVMDNDEKVRDNRISLLSRVTRLYKGFADFSRIIIDNGIK